jgi:protein-tyrosine phosphatase
MEISILFVCLGNICRSPLAEGIFRGLVEEAGLSHRFRVDSAGTGSWHVGEPPDTRAQSVARSNGVRLAGSARRIEAADLTTFDWVIAMDRSNRESIESLSGPLGEARLHLLREFDPEDGDPDVPDPYYGGASGFQEVFDIVDRSCRVLLDHVLEEDGD